MCIYVCAVVCVWYIGVSVYSVCVCVVLTGDVCAYMLVLWYVCGV